VATRRDLQGEHIARTGASGLVPGMLRRKNPERGVRPTWSGEASADRDSEAHLPRRGVTRSRGEAQGRRRAEMLVKAGDEDP
jgi:hypothetical protein